MMVGGAQAASSVTPEHQAVADACSNAARTQYLGAAAGDEMTPWPAFVVTEVLTQVVAGTNYFVKVRVSSSDAAEAEHVQMRIFCSLPHVGAAPELVSLRKGEAAEGALAYF